MLEPLMNVLHTQKIILASGSPRRKEILATVGLPFEVVPSRFDENLDKTSFSTPAEYARETSLRKALEVAQRLREQNEHFDLIVSADTVVVQDGEIFEKPATDEDARNMLTRFVDSVHHVCSGVTLLSSSKSSGDPCVTQFHESTEVEFGGSDDVTTEMIASYVATGESLDKAGGYGIQAKGGTLVKNLHGCYFNVMGLPLFSFCRHLTKLYSTKKEN